MTQKTCQKETHTEGKRDAVRAHRFRGDQVIRENPATHTHDDRTAGSSLIT